ncbi:MAG: hypothetical protein ABI726_05080 [bacterium]
MADRDLDQVRAELARVRAELRRTHDNHAATTLLLEAKHRLMGEEWELRGGGVYRSDGALRLRGGRSVLAPHEARRRAAEAFARVLRGRHPGTSWEGKTDDDKEDE